jgi:hypothetical protein
MDLLFKLIELVGLIEGEMIEAVYCYLRVSVLEYSWNIIIGMNKKKYYDYD